MRILWWTTATPFAPTAYAKVTSYMTRELAALGHEVHILPTTGLRWGHLDVGGHRVHGHPTGEPDPDMMLWLFGRLGCDLVVWHADAWIWQRALAEAAAHVPLVLYSPIDHDPLVDVEVELMRRVAGVAVPSRWAVERCREAGIEAHYVPHGVALDVFRPAVSAPERRELRRQLGWDQNALVFLTVAVNRGTRKNLANLLRAFAMLPADVDGRPVHLCLHAYPFRDGRNESGLNLHRLAEHLGVQDRVYWPEPMLYLQGLAEAEVAKLYRASDVHVMASKTEGFGVPIIEAAASGVPSVVTAFAAMAELVRPERGWLVPVADYDVEPLLDYAWWAIPSTTGLATVMLDAARHPDDVRQRGQAAQRHAQGFTWTAAAQAMDQVLRRVISSPGRDPGNADASTAPARLTTPH